MAFAWHVLKLGGGGFSSGIDIAADGTKVSRTDVSGAYVCTTANPIWQQIVNSAALPSGDLSPLTTDTVGAFEIVIAPSNTQRFYMMWNNWVYISDNRGTTWTRTAFTQVTGCNPNGGAQRLFGMKMAVDPINADVCYVGTVQNGLWQTLDAGASWTKMTAVADSTIDGQLNGIIIAFDPSSSVVSGKTQGIYASSYGHGVYHSTNAGSSWTLTTSGPTSHQHMVVRSTGAVWLTAWPDGATNNMYIYSGGSWTNPTIGNQPLRHVTVAFDPNDANHIVISMDSGDLTVSTNNGSSWTGPTIFGHTRIATDVPWLAVTNENYMSTGDMKFDPVSGDLYFAEGIGIWKTSAPTLTAAWTSQTAGIESLVAYQALSTPGLADAVTLGGGDRVLWWSDDFDAYATINRPSFNPDAINNCYGLDWATSSPTFIAALCNKPGTATSCYSTDSGDNWTAFPTWHDSLLLTTNASTAIGNPVLHFASVPASVAIGDHISVTGFSNNTMVIAVTGTTVTMDENATALVSSSTVVNFQGQPGGSIAASTPNNIVIVPSNSSSFPKYTKDGGTTWNNVDIPGVPRVGTGTTTSGSPIITGINFNTSALTFQQSMLYYQPHFPPNANPSVLTVDSPTQITVNSNANANGLCVLTWETGWGFAYYLNRKSVTADRVTANKFYLYNTWKGLYTSTDSGDTWTNTYSGQIAGDNGGAGARLSSVPGHAGHLFMTGSNAAYQNNPLAFSINGGVSWTNVSGSLSYVETFDFGAAAPGGTYPTIFITAKVAGVRSVYRTDNFDPATNTPTWIDLGAHPNDTVDVINCIGADQTEYGRIFVGFSGSGWAYGDFGGDTPTPPPGRQRYIVFNM